MEWERVLTLLWEPNLVVRLEALILLIVLDVGFGIALAIKEARFDWKKVAQFAQTKLIPYVVGYYFAYMVAMNVSNFNLSPVLGGAEQLVNGVLPAAMWLALVTNLAADILEKVRAFLPETALE